VFPALHYIVTKSNQGSTQTLLQTAGVYPLQVR